MIRGGLSLAYTYLSSRIYVNLFRLRGVRGLAFACLD